MKKEEVDKIGKGRVWTGNQAKELGLVDELGGLTRAIEVAKELAHIPADEAVKLLVWPRKVRFIDMLMGRRLTEWGIGQNSRVEKIAQALEFLKRDKTLAIMPAWIAPEF